MQRWRELEWVDRFGYSVITGFAVAIIVLAACSTVVDGPGPTLSPEPFPSFVPSTTLPATTTTFCGPDGVPYNECPSLGALHISIDDVHGQVADRGH